MKNSDRSIVAVVLILMFVIFITLAFNTANQSDQIVNLKDKVIKLQEENKKIGWPYVPGEPIVERPKLKKHEYIVEWSGDQFEAKEANTIVQLHGGDPSFEKGFNISVPSKQVFVGTSIYIHQTLDRSNKEKRYIFAKFYKDGKLVYEADTANYSGIAYMDLGWED